MIRSRISAVALALSLGWAGACLAQDAPKDDALDRLLDKLGGTATPAAAEPKPKAKDAKKDAPKDKPKDKPKPAPEAEPKDKALDNLLEKLGETKEAPETTGQTKPGDTENPNLPRQQPKPGDAPKDSLKEEQKPLDDRLEELTGRVKKKKGGDQSGQQGQQGGESDENSPIGEAVKKMREVETKLGETDTGEETRKKQGEIIKDLEQLIAQAKAQGQGKGKPGKPSRQPGQQPGDQPGDQPGTDPNARGAGPMAPKTPAQISDLIGSKDIWGNLPPMLRAEMENAFSTQPLPKKSRQISRYYESVSKKSLNPSRGD